MAGNGKEQTFRAPNGIFLSGNLTTDPELKFTPSGTAALSFRIAVDGAGNRNDAGFFTCTAWGKLAENLAESVHKGDRVVVAGKLRHRSFELDSGKKSSSIELAVDDCGPSMQWATAQVIKKAGSGQQAAAPAPVPEPVGA
jgi:single-strand DNA-binding protein